MIFSLLILVLGGAYVATVATTHIWLPKILESIGGNPVNFKDAKNNS